MAKLPMYPFHPEGLQTKLLPHQLQGLAWMIQCEHPRHTAPCKAHSKSLKHTQFWKHIEATTVS
jgi:hypothetical protein